MWDPTNTIQHSVTVCRQCRSLDCCAVVMMGAAKSQSQIGFFANLQDVQFFFCQPEHSMNDMIFGLSMTVLFMVFDLYL